MFERKKLCPVCHEVAAVLDGDPVKYGDKAMPWNRFIATKYCCDECRAIMNGQSHRIAVKRFREQSRKRREAALEAVDVLREEIRVSREEARTSREEVRLSRQYISELEARLT